MGQHVCTHHVPRCGDSIFYKYIDLLNIYSLSLPGSLKISPSPVGARRVWDGVGNEAATTGLEEPPAALPWGNEISRVGGKNAELWCCLRFGDTSIMVNAAHGASN